MLRERLTTVDWLAPLVIVVALVVYVVHGFNGQLDRDRGVYMYGGQQFADGVPPYESILNRAGPLAHILPGVGVVVARWVGIGDIRGARVLYLLLSVATVCVIYLAGRHLYASRWVGLATAAAFLTFGGFIEYATNGPREKTPMVLFLSLTLLFLVRRRFVAAGVFVGLGALTWQPSLLVAGTACLATVATLGDRRLRSLIEIAVGGAIPTILCALYFSVNGAFRTFVEGFYLINAKYSEGEPFSAQERWHGLEQAYGWSLWLILVGLLGMIVVAALSVAIKERRLDPKCRTVAAFGVSTVVALIWTWNEINGWADLLLLLPGAALGIGGLTAEAARRLSAGVLVPVVAGLSMVAAAFALTFSFTNRSDALERQRASVHEVFAHLPADATMMSLGAPQAMAIAQRTNPTRHQVLAGALLHYLDDHWPGGKEGFGQWVIGRHPTVIAVHGQLDWIKGDLTKHYRLVGRAPTWSWYLDRSLGRDVIDDVRAALQREKAHSREPSD